MTQLFYITWFYYKILLHYFIIRDKGKDKGLNFITSCCQPWTIYIPKCYDSKTRTVAGMAAWSTAPEITLDFPLFLRTLSIIMKYKHNQRNVSM